MNRIPLLNRLHDLSSPGRRRKNMLSILGILLLAYLGTYLTHGLESQIDIDLSDEMHYLASGKSGQYIACRVLYPFWYNLLGYFRPDTVDLFFFNQQVLAWFLPACLFLFLYRWLGEFIPCLFFSVLFLYSNTNIGTEYIYNHELQAVSLYKINHFTLALVFLFSLLILKLHRSGIRTVPLMTLAFFILSYARNEYGVLFVLFGALYIFQFFRHYRNDRRERYFFYGFWTCAALIMGVYGLSVLISEFSHLHYVLSYSWNYLDRNHLPVNATSDFISPAAKIFGYPNSLAGFFMSNPWEFCVNIAFNFYNMFLVNSFRVADIVIPQVWISYRDMGTTNYILAGLILTGISGAFILTHRKRITACTRSAYCGNATQSPDLRTGFRNLIPYLVGVLNDNPVILFHLLIILITIAGNTVYMYDPRYFIHFAPALFYLAVISIRHLPGKKMIYFLQGAVLCYIFLNPPDIFRYMKQNNYHPEQHVLNTMGIIRDYMHTNDLDSLHILTNDGDYGQVIPGVKTTNYSIISMHSDPGYAERLTDLNRFDIITLKKYSVAEQDYFWYNQVTNYLSGHQHAFIHHKSPFREFQSHIYLRKRTPAN